MSDLIEKLRKRVDDKLGGPFIDERAAAAALWVVQQAEEIAQELAEEHATTERAAEVTGWNQATLQRHANAVLSGESVASEWRGLRVEKVGIGYVFVLSSIPKKMKASA